MSDSLPPSMLNSPVYWLPPHFWSWLAVSLFLLVLIYAAKVISREKKQFHQDGSWITWKNFELFVPAWWTQKNENWDSLFFYRADTHYDWFFTATLSTHPAIESAKISYLTTNHITLDAEAVITTEKNYLLKNKLILDEVEDFLRIESTATENEEDRIYLDVIWIKFKNNAVIEFISKSSVLSGGVEGPYVEEVIKEIKFKN